MKKTAAVITPRCPYSAERLYGIRIEKRGNTWGKTWSFSLKEEVAQREHFSSQIEIENFVDDQEYPGCPFCSSHELAQCGNCQKIYCYKDESQVRCPWCGSESEVVFGQWERVSGGGY